MYNGQNISLGSIVYKVLNLPITSQLNYEDAAEYSIEALRLIGAPLAFEKKSKIIEIKEYRGSMPNGIIKLNGVRYAFAKCDLNNSSVPLQYATDIYHKTYKTDGYPNTQYTENKDYSYTLEKKIIYISEEEGFVEINYDSIILDEDGYPMIPDVEEVKLAIEYYIIFRYIEPIWASGKITDKVFSYYDQQKSWYMGAANSSLQNPSVDRMQSIVNSINRLIPAKNFFYNYYKKSGIIEQVRRS